MTEIIKSKKLGKKKIIYLDDNEKYINEWYNRIFMTNLKKSGIMNTRGNDFQNYNYIRISSCNNFNHTNIITKNNLIPSCIYLSVRHCIKADWINDRDQFLYPNESWKEDKELHCDCLAFTLFHPQNRITSKDGHKSLDPFH
ncbi:hypothetical protein [Brachyspira hyodysenteriae]|uniref:hypothetical protein n=1 Tax=Brachyspira hyodysenteriae TaxID=159 RepID=UPI0022CD5B1F|nr:hypothetical protein [Brachyspira hyodysenteriae]MCZ9840629.1 hypothetical protein [Brachyspira hyodysenteriae]